MIVMVSDYSTQIAYEILRLVFLFFFNDTAPPEIYTLSLHDALPISPTRASADPGCRAAITACRSRSVSSSRSWPPDSRRDRKSTRLNSSHPSISYAVFCLKKKKKISHAYTKKKKKREKV